MNSAVIALALELNTRGVVLDDIDSRQFARHSGLEPVGALNLLLAVKENGLIEKVAPKIEALRNAGFRVSETRVREILAQAEGK